jgi:isocitrate lyase
MAATGRTSTTKAMGKGSTQFQHLIQTEVPPKLLENWLQMWTGHHQLAETLRVSLRPHRAGSDLLALSVLDNCNSKTANVIFANIQDRRERSILSIRDQNTFNRDFRQMRLMTLIHLYLIYRYRVDSVHYVSPTDDNQKQTAGMQALAIYSDVNTEVGDIIVAAVNQERVKSLLDTDRLELTRLITKDVVGKAVKVT